MVLDCVPISVPACLRALPGSMRPVCSPCPRTSWHPGKHIAHINMWVKDSPSLLTGNGRAVGLTEGGGGGSEATYAAALRRAEPNCLLWQPYLGNCTAVSVLATILTPHKPHAESCVDRSAHMHGRARAFRTAQALYTLQVRRLRPLCQPGKLGKLISAHGRSLIKEASGCGRSSSPTLNVASCMLSTSPTIGYMALCLVLNQLVRVHSPYPPLPVCA